MFSKISIKGIEKINIIVIKLKGWDFSLLNFVYVWIYNWIIVRFLGDGFKL